MNMYLRLRSEKSRMYFPLMFGMILFLFLASSTTLSAQSLIHPVKYFASKPKSVTEKSYYANVSTAEAIR